MDTRSQASAGAASSSSSDAETQSKSAKQAAEWKRLMTSHATRNEPVYLAPSLTRTPTPPLLLDRSNNAASSSGAGAVHTNSQAAPSDANTEFVRAFGSQICQIQLLLIMFNQAGS